MATVQTDDADGACLDSRCTPTLTFSSAHEVLMVLIETALCERTVYKNGTERNLHRGANVHARDVICKGPECNRNVTKARTLFADVVRARGDGSPPRGTSPTLNCQSGLSGMIPCCWLLG